MSETKTKLTVTIDPTVLKAAKDRSEQSGVPVSVAVERLLALWAETGELPERPAKEGKAKKKA